MKPRSLRFTVAGTALLLLGLFTVASILDTTLGLQIVAGLQGFGAFALLAVTGVYAWLTRQLLRSQQEHYQALRRQVEQGALNAAWGRMTAFAGLLGQLMSSTRSLFGSGHTTEAALAAAKRMTITAGEVNNAVQELLSVIPAVPMQALESCQRFALIGGHAALTTQRLAGLVLAEVTRAKSSASTFSLNNVASEWEQEDHDGDGTKYPRWAELSSGRYLRDVANEQMELALKVSGILVYGNPPTA